MIKKIVLIALTFALTLGVNAASDGDLILTKNDPKEIKIVLKNLIEPHSY